DPDAVARRLDRPVLPCRHAATEAQIRERCDPCCANSGEAAAHRDRCLERELGAESARDLPCRRRLARLVVEDLQRTVGRHVDTVRLAMQLEGAAWAA